MADAPVSPADVPLPEDVRAYLLRGGAALDAVATAPLWLVRTAADWVTWWRSPTVPTRSVHNVYLDGDGGSIQLRVYVPPADAAVAGACPILYAHGGGYVLCSLDTHDWLCRRMALRTGCTVVSVAYRMPPEHPAPTMQRDVAAAYAWVVSHAAALSSGEVPAADAAPAPAATTAPGVIVAGDSAGGNLATTLCLQLLMARRGQPTFLDAPVAATLPLPAAQVLIYPGVDFTSQRPSLRRYESGWLLSARFRTAALSLYMGPDEAAAAAKRRDPRYSPLLAPAELLAGMPRTVLLTAEHDMLHDEGVAYAQALASAGVRAEHIEARGLFHGFASMPEFAGGAAEGAAAAGARAGAAAMEDVFARVKQLATAVK
jgi:acetyl esterase